MELTTTIISLLVGLTLLNVSVFHGIYFFAGKSSKKTVDPDLPKIRTKTPYGNFWVLSMLLASTDVMAISLMIHK
jgi:putative copper export protein